MKYSIIVFLLTLINVFCLPTYAQQGDHINVFSGLPFPGSNTRVQSPYNNSQASLVHAEGGYAIDMTIAGINTQTIQSMAMDNHLKRIDTFFKGRENNMYYRDMEEWRKKERIRLKGLGIYDGDAIRKLYGR